MGIKFPRKLIFIFGICTSHISARAVIGEIRSYNVYVRGRVQHMHDDEYVETARKAFSDHTKHNIWGGDTGLMW